MVRRAAGPERPSKREPDLQRLCQGISLLCRLLRNIVQFRENEAIRLCLKHFRQRNLLSTFEALQKQSHVRLEDSLLTDLYQKLVHSSDFVAAESILNAASNKHLFDEYISDCKYKHKWRKIVQNDGISIFIFILRLYD